MGLVSGRPLSLGSHVESQENKKLCFCMASLALNSRLGEACHAKKKKFYILRESKWPPSDKSLINLKINLFTILKLIKNITVRKI